MFNAVRNFLKGFRTLLSAGAFAVIGLLSVAGSLDLTPVVALFVRDPAMLGAAMVGVGLLFALLRYVSTSAIGQSVPAPVVDEAPEDFKARAKTDEGE